jgi:two-component system chemotaxis response regulator CheB
VVDLDRVENVLPVTQGVGNAPIRVMIVDESAIVRGLITRMLQADSGVEVVASVNNGDIAVRTL